MKSCAWKKTLMGLALSALGFWAGHQIAAQGSLQVSGTVLSMGPSAAQRAIRLPYQGERSSAGTKLSVQGSIRAHGGAAHRVRVVADDCLTELKIDGTPITLTPIEGDLCDWKAGSVFDLGTWLTPEKEHHFVASFVNSGGGPHGLRIETSLGRAGRFFRLFFYTLAILALVAPWVLPHWAAFAMIVPGVWLRLWMVLDFAPMDRSIYSDMLGYWDRAQQLLHGTFLLEHFVQPLGISFLAAASLKVFGGLIGLQWLHVLLSVATVLVAWRAFERILTRKESLVILAVLSLHLPWISMNSLLMAETVFTFLLSAMFWFVFHPDFLKNRKILFWAGFLFALAYGFKGNHAFFAPLLAAWVFFRAPRTAWKTLSPFALGAAVPLLAFATWTWSNYGEPRMSADTGVINWVEGKCPPGKHFDSGGSWYWSPLFVQLNESQVSRWPARFSDSEFFWKAGWKCIADQPSVLLRSFRYLYYLFDGNTLWPSAPEPFEDWVKWFGRAYALWTIPGILMGLWAVYRRGSPYAHLRVAFLPVLGLFLCTWVLKGELRYRLPFDAIILALAFLGWRQHRSHPVETKSL